MRLQKKVVRQAQFFFRLNHSLEILFFSSRAEPHALGLFSPHFSTSWGHLRASKSVSIVLVSSIKDSPHLPTVTGPLSTSCSSMMPTPAWSGPSCEADDCTVHCEILDAPSQRTFDSDSQFLCLHVVFACMYVCMYVCMYASMFACSVRMYECCVYFVWTSTCIFVSMCVLWVVLHLEELEVLLVLLVVEGRAAVAG